MRNGGVSKTRKTALGAALVALAVGGAGEALAGDVHAKLTIKSKRTVGKDTIFGRVIAKERACEARRKVKLVVTRPDRSRNQVAVLKTDGKGKWKYVPESGNAVGGYTNEGTRYADPGDYRSKVREENLRGVTCAANKSSKAYVG